MRNFVKLSLAFLLIASVSLSFYNCGETTDSDLSVVVTQDKEILRKGDMLKINISATTTNDKIASVTLTKGTNALSIPAVTDDENYTEEIEYTVDDNDGKIEFTLTVTGTNLVDPIVKTITIYVVTDVEVSLGAETSPLPSFMNGTTLTTYNATNAAANQDKVDLVYKFTTADGAMIGAPSDAAFTLASWTTKNATKVAIITEQKLEAVEGISGTVVKNLKVGDLIGYITVSGTKGIIVIKNVVTGTDGNTTMTFSVIM